MDYIRASGIGQRERVDVMGRGRALEASLGADDIPSDLRNRFPSEDI